MVTWERDLALDSAAATPLYHQLRERLRAVVRELPEGATLPPEKDLMTFAGVSRATARRAVGELVLEGALIVRQGKGTFVAPQRVPTELGRSPAGFSEIIRRAGRVPGSRIIETAEVPASGELAVLLEVAEGSSVVVVERLRLIDGQPAMVERVHFSAALVPGLLEEDLTGSLYDLLRQRYGLPPASGSETIIAVSAEHRLANLLGVPAGAPLLATTRSTRTSDGTRLEYTLRHARGDLCSFVVQLHDAQSGFGPIDVAMRGLAVTTHA